MRQLARVQQPLDRLRQRDAGADEDREHDEVPGDLLASLAPKEEGDAERDRGQGVADVVDQVCEQGDAAAGGQDQRLSEGGRPEHDEAERDRPNPRMTAKDRPVDETMGVAVVPLHGGSLP